MTLYGLPDLQGTDSVDVVHQNTINLVLLWMAGGGLITSSALSAPPGSEVKGMAWIISGTATGHWAGHAANTIAIANSDLPSSAAGWVFLTPRTGQQVHVLAGASTGNLFWNGSSYAAL